MEQVSDDDLRKSLDPETNSIAVIAKHIAGNLTSRWTDFRTTDGEKPWRDRDNEFIDTFGSRAELLECWEAGWAVVTAAISGLQPEDFERTLVVRGEPHSLPLAVTRSLAHMAYHVGQIVMIARILAGDQWKVLTIGRGESNRYNELHWGQVTVPQP